MLIKLKDRYTIGSVMDFLVSNELNYEVVRETKEEETENVITKLEIKDNSIQNTCYGCPSVYEFVGLDNKQYYFRIRNGYWRLVNETDDIILATGSGYSLGLDGYASWDEAKQLMLEEKYCIIEKEEEYSYDDE